jgi:hypothetical protein
MRVCDSFIHEGKVFAACAGSDISRDMHISKIRIDGVEYDVKHADIRESFIGVLQAMLEVDSSRLVPKGNVTIMA